MPAKRNREALLQKLLLTPETVIEQLDLVYVDEGQFPICRRRRGKGFTYLKDGEKVSSKRLLKRVKQLVIPPAWTEVRITDKANGHLQAYGNDLKGRRQYIYHPMWTKIRNQSKFYKMLSFGKELPRIRKKVKKDIRQHGWPKSKVLALVIRLMEATHIRIGGQQYARENNSYGLASMRKKHVKHKGSEIVFEFEGKKGIKHQITLEDPKLIRLVNQCEEIPGWQLFQYYENEQDKQLIDSGMVNEYLHDISGEFFTAKDFRTWSGSLLFFEQMAQLAETMPNEELQSQLNGVLDHVAGALGNTRAVTRNYYVHPALISASEEGRMGEYIAKIKKHKDSKYFSATEKVLLKLLNENKPELLEEVTAG